MNGGARQRHRGALYDALLQATAAKHGVSLAAAALAFNELGKKQRQSRKDAVEREAAARRRAAAGNPVFRPRDDYLGQVRRA